MTQYYHLSHTDLDGYSSQLVSRELLANNIIFFNANYGREIGNKLEIILKIIENKQEKQKHHILITDLNLTLQECSYLEAKIQALQNLGKDVSLQLLDHHQTGAECARKYEWYFLDNERSATKITFDTFKKKKLLKKFQYLEDFTEMVNTIDLWKEDERYFEFGKVAMRLIADSREINRIMFEANSVSYKLALLKMSSKYLRRPDSHILLDNAMHKMKKKCLSIKNKDDTLDNIASQHQIKLFATNLDSCTLHINNYKGYISYSVGNISVVANEFLHHHPEYHFFMDIGPRGTVSIRSLNRCDVAEIAKELFGGGGHINASGGKIDGFKESFLYSEIKQNLINYIKGKQR